VRELLTNDDGVGAEGIGAVRAALTDLFDSVITVAPEADCSGFFSRLTEAFPIGSPRNDG
jgi:broad specificity polyphosphatase/5'/3'-nucleotidase SurE